MDRIPNGEAHFYQDVLIRCQSCHDDYACSCGGVAMSSGDGMDPSTQVPVVRCTWLPKTMSYRDRHLMPLPPEAPSPTSLLGMERPLGVTARGLGMHRDGSRRIYS
jgi:hypothetical protein